MQALPKVDARQASGKNSPTHANALGWLSLTFDQAKLLTVGLPPCRRSINHFPSSEPDNMKYHMVG
jgi:hypothetical protein